ncbi:hypothetical protein [Streptomyces sp. NBC_00557]|uniref:hypothetical protein n=1 Tax=Streptomyces sp. NBC_00557 TaxID=2975776 RepID=UPI002E821B9A|nr:hypothetical protein [Streptomyces sp. NBC_00557]
MRSVLRGRQARQDRQGLQGRRGHQARTAGTGTCPDGYSLQAPSYDPDALVCRKDGAPQPSDSNTPTTPQALGLDPHRRQYL